MKRNEMMKSLFCGKKLVIKSFEKEMNDLL